MKHFGGYILIISFMVMAIFSFSVAVSNDLTKPKARNEKANSEQPEKSKDESISNNSNDSELKKREEPEAAA